MKEKHFLIGFAVVYLVIGFFFTWLWGPPGHSEEYMAEHAQEHEHYLEIVKSEAYKRYQQLPDSEMILEEYERLPHLSPPYEELMSGVVFVEEYESNPDFQAEERRLFKYNLFFDIFNVAAFLVIAVRYGRKPLLDFLDDQIARVRNRFERVEQERDAAVERKQAAESKLAGLDDEKNRIEAQARTLIEQEEENARAMTEQALAQLEKETEERRELAFRQAAMRVKRELVEQSVAELVDRLKAGRSPERQNRLVKEFVNQLKHVDGHAARNGS